MRFFKNLVGFIVGATFSMLALTSIAMAGTYDSIITAVDWSAVVTGVVSIGALVAAVFIVLRGVRMLLSVIRR